MIRVLIADDHQLLRDVLESYLQAEGGFEVAVACDVDTAVEQIAELGAFDLVLLDYSMPGMNGFMGLDRVIAANGGKPVALMSGTAPDAVAQRALERGAVGFLPKSLPAKSVVNAIRFMASGEIYLPLAMLRQGGAAPAAETPFVDMLTARERQVLHGLCLGKSNKEIARDLDLREPTIKLHVKLVCRKLTARNRTHAAMLAKEAGFC